MKYPKIFLCFLIVLSACGRSPHQRQDEHDVSFRAEQLRSTEESLRSFITTTDPVLLAIEECKRGDLTLLELRDAASTVPGWSAKLGVYATRVLIGSSDCVSGESGEQVQTMAQQFAIAYNAAKLGWSASK